MAVAVAFAVAETDDVDTGDALVAVGETLGVVVDIAVAVAVAVGDAVAVGVAVALSVGVGVGVGTAHNVKFVVQEAPRDGQQYDVDPHKTVVPTFAIVEQLYSSGDAPTTTE